MTRRERGLALCAALLLLAAGYVLGQRMGAATVHALCDAGTPFHRLGAVDTPYRCTRIVDYPPTPGAPR